MLFETESGFAGEGPYYSNARWYDPTLGRFITEDPARSGDNWFAYAKDNPLTLIDPTGLDSFAAIFNRATNAMTATCTYTSNDVGVGRQTATYTWAAANNVQNSISTTSPAPGQTYYPQSFPGGTWKLQPSVSKDINHATFGPVAVPTNASQAVTTAAASGTNPATGQPAYAPSGTAKDYGYWIHGGGWSTPNPAVLNDLNDTTFGCIRMPNQDVTQFATLSDAALKSGGSSTITIRGPSVSAAPASPPTQQAVPPVLNNTEEPPTQP